LGEEEHTKWHFTGREVAARRPAKKSVVCDAGGAAWVVADGPVVAASALAGAK
jgi:hypothetical protein